VPLAEWLEIDRRIAARGLAQAGSSPAGSSAATPVSAGGGAAGSEGIDGGSGAVAGSGASLADDPDPPNKRFNQLLMRAMLQGRSAGR